MHAGCVVHVQSVMRVQSVPTQRCVWVACFSCQGGAAASVCCAFAAAAHVIQQDRIDNPLIIMVAHPFLLRVCTCRWA